MIRSNYFIFMPLLVYDFLMECYGDEIIHEFEHYIMKSNEINASYRFDERISLKAPHLQVLVNENGYTVGVSGCRPTLITPAWIQKWCAENSNTNAYFDLKRWSDA